MPRLPLLARALARRATVPRCLPRIAYAHSLPASSQPPPPPAPLPSSPPPSPQILGPLAYLPARLHPYLFLTRLDKPTGTWLLFLPCSWSIALASHSLSLPPSIPLSYTALFALGAFIMRGAGCTINDMWDRRLDRLVARTASRPLASGALSLRQATYFLALQLSAGLAVLTQLNWYSIALGASSLGLVGVYPYMKRVTYWPQFVLGLTFNWGALLGWAAVSAPPVWEVVIPLYASGVCWTLVYDTIYAHQDKTDDAPAQIRSTALLFAHHTPPILALFSASFLSLLALSGSLAGLTAGPFYAISVGGAAVGLAKIIRDVDWDDRASCWTGFRRNIGVGAVVAAGIWAEYLWVAPWRDQERREGEETEVD